MNTGEIAVLGFGNLAFHLVRALNAIPGLHVTVYVRDKSKHKKWIEQLPELIFVDQIEQLPVSAKYCFCAVSDDQIKKVCSELPEPFLKSTTLLHCSGVLPANLLSELTNNRGLFYPLNSFTKDHAFSWESVPVFIDSPDAKVRKELWDLALQLGGRPVKNKDSDRAVLHLAAVMVNNFTNHLFSKADDVLTQHHIPFDYLLPLIKTTVAKLDHLKPKNAQTGPALRGDEKTISKHLQLIDDPALRELYLQLSKSINSEILIKSS